ncbi:LuxR C-terminal-related transcriptional regulator [Amycolatopsis tolypomycina]|uniref:LuxR C-terminal-related transcriptional regulator n=1 Tax=Amycolatopsis tolypomycina TaxID=208445 RepID=UPI00339E9728
MIRDCSALPGRGDEVAALEKVAGRPVLVVLRGVAGAGKTAVLGAVRKKWHERGMKIIHVSFSAGDSGECGVPAVLAAFHAEFGTRCDTKLAAVNRLCSSEDTGSSPSDPALFTELTRLFGALRQSGPAAVVFDDLHAVPDSGFTIAAARYAGCTVLAACRDEEAVEPTLLSALADQVVDLRPLTDGEIDELLADRGPVDPAVAPALRAALGSLRGNPGAVLAVRDELERAGRLVPVRGVRCLADPTAPIALPPGHERVRQVTRLPEPAPALAALVGVAGTIPVDALLRLAETAGWEPAACGRATDRLVAAGVLGCDERGELFVPCPALATAVLNTLGERTHAIHALVAGHLLHGDAAFEVEPLAGPEVRSEPDVVARLCREAARISPAASATRWYRTALAHCAASGPGPDSGRVLGLGRDPDTGRGRGPGSGPGPGPGLGLGPGSGFGPGSGRDSGPGPGPDTGSGSGPGPDSGRVLGLGRDPDTGRGRGPGPGSGPGLGLGPEAGPGPGRGPGPSPDTGRDRDRDRDRDPDPDPGLGPRPGSGPDPSPDPGRVSDLTRSLLRLLVRIGRHDWLPEVVAEVVADGVPAGLEYELAVAAALGALHTGIPVTSTVAAELAVDPAGRPPLEFAGLWFDGREAMSLDGFVAAFGAFRLGGAPDAAPVRDQLEIWAGRHDLVALFGFLFGAEYGVPEGGPLALYHRVITGYHRGEWAEVLSAVRVLELSGQPTTPAHSQARLLAAEIQACEGEFELAAEWLAAAGGSPFPAIATWAETGLLWRSGRLHEAVDAGWRGYEKAAAAAERGNPIGMHWLLVRLTMLESEAGGVERLAELRTLARKWYRRYGGRRLQMADLMVTSLVERDFASARAAVEVVRNHDNQSELMRACLIASSSADEPRPWLHEAYDIARRLGGDLLRMTIKARMRERGVAPPRRHLASADLSATELRIIALIRQGLTNRQIAGALRISEKTVESHLTRLFAKTGCRSRLDLATASIEGRLTVAGLDRNGTA